MKHPFENDKGGDARRQRRSLLKLARLLNVAVPAAILSSVGLPAHAGSADPDAAAKALIARYVATFDVDPLLEDPAIKPELHSLLGPALGTLKRNLGVTGGVEYIGGALSVRGNASHQGTEEEAVICIQPYAATPRVHAAIYSKGNVTVFTREKRYNYLTECIKDWITLVTSRHVDRMKQPKNVQMRTKN